MPRVFEFARMAAMKCRALVTAELVRHMLDSLADRIDFEFAGYAIDHEVMPRDELKRRVADVDILVCEYDTIDAEIFDAAHSLRPPRRPVAPFRPRPQRLPRRRGLQGHPPLRRRNRGTDAETENTMRVVGTESLRVLHPQPGNGKNCRIRSK